jgi:hypothetical protein
MSTPAEFIRFEEALNRLETGGRLEYAAGMLEALQAVRLAVEAQEANAASAKEGLKSMLESVKSDVADTLERYSKQASAAKGTDYSSLFTESDKKISKLIDEAEDALEEDPRLLSEKINALDKSRERMELTLESLRNESESKVRLLEVVLEDSGLDESRKKGFAEKLVAMRRMVSGGDYVNALRAGSAIAKELDSGEREGNEGVLVLGVTALAALTAAGFYVAKQQKPKKELKRLTSFSAPALRAGPDLPREPAAPQEPQDRSSQNSQPPDQSQRPAP